MSSVLPPSGSRASRLRDTTMSLRLELVFMVCRRRESCFPSHPLSLSFCVCVCKVRSVQKTNCHTAARGGGGGEKRKVKQRRLCSSRRCCDPESGLRRVNHRVQNSLRPSFFVFCNNNNKNNSHTLASGDKAQCIAIKLPAVPRSSTRGSQLERKQTPKNK